MQFQCPNCHGIIAVDNSDMGLTVQCGNCFETVDVPSHRVMPGTVVGDFLILEQIGQGGMGVVFRAHQISLDRPAALKILSAHYVGNAEFITGFIKEARAAAQLNHPHIVQAFAVGDDEGVFYFAMEYIDGETMKEILKREHVIPVEFAISVMQQISEALDYAWKESNIVHRDIKPDNIMITTSLKAKLADLGLARSANEANQEVNDEVMGTPQYISPEQLTGAPVDNRTDIYSLGATFFHLVTGRFPFEGSTAIEIAEKHLSEPLTPAHIVNPNVPEMVSLVISKMMAKNPNERYQSAESLIEDLAMVSKGKLPPSLASMHGGGFAGKTLILVNDRSHVTSREVKQEVKKKSISLPLILGGGVVAVIVIIAVILAVVGQQAPPPVITEKPYLEKLLSVMEQGRALAQTDPVAAIQLMKIFDEGPDEAKTEQDILNRNRLRDEIAKIEEYHIIRKSDIRKKMENHHRTELTKIQNELSNK